MCLPWRLHGRPLPFAEGEGRRPQSNAAEGMGLLVRVPHEVGTSAEGRQHTGADGTWLGVALGHAALKGDQGKGLGVPCTDQGYRWALNGGDLVVHGQAASASLH